MFNVRKLRNMLKHGVCNLSKKRLSPIKQRSQKKSEQISLQIAQGGFNMVFTQLNLFKS